MKNISDKISTTEQQTQFWRLNVWNKKGEMNTTLFIWQILIQKWDWHLFDICLD